MRFFKEPTMRDRLFTKSRTSEILGPARAGERRPLSEREEEDCETERETEILLKTRIPDTLQKIGEHLGRTLATLERMERRLEEFAR
jgi:hypothetical protein